MAVLDSYYEYEEDGLYCYPGTYVLKNKLDIRDGGSTSNCRAPHGGYQRLADG